MKELFQLKTEGAIGEVWTLSGHKSSVSVCLNGDLAGKKITEIIQEYPSLYLGHTEKDCFPILISFLYAEQNLSVQVHPDDTYALKYDGDYGKTESWYILEAESGTRINYGHTFPNRHVYEQAITDGRVEEYLQYIDVQEDDFILIPPGTVHTVTPGILLIEIQQTSDVTYRVYDWGRGDAVGDGRELHVDRAADVLIYHSQTVPCTRKRIKQLPNETYEQLIHDPDCFSIDKWDFSKTLTLSMGKKGQPDVLICARGEGTLHYKDQGKLSIQAGDTILVPADFSTYMIQSRKTMTLLRVFYEK
ncbi:class I mannose-6-phosphate isomerase [Lederbergia sp. NSJ-179]|nr:class I mannose-6-phosphate isomerase [Lederbergia sp. NSJ-179]